MRGQYVYFQELLPPQMRNKKVCGFKIGQTVDVYRRGYEIGYIEHYQYFEIDYAEALFIESYLRMKFVEYAKAHPAIGLAHYGNDHFYYNPRYYGIMNKIFVRYYTTWMAEAYAFIQKTKKDFSEIS